MLDVQYRVFVARLGQVFLNLLIDNAFLLVVAIGMTFVILAGGIDLSVGAVLALAATLWSLGVRSGLTKDVQLGF